VCGKASSSSPCRARRVIATGRRKSVVLGGCGGASSGFSRVNGAALVGFFGAC
jgi:hypothetical protein